MLTSIKNPRIQHIRKLQSSARARREASLFVVEGVRLTEEALAAGWGAESLLFTDGLNPRGRAVLEGFRAQGVEVLPVTPQVMRVASDTQTPQGILAVLPIHSLPLPPTLDFVLIPDGVRDPGNLGTMLRTALAAGVDAVLLPPGAVDPFSPKVARSAMGAHFKMPVHLMEWEDIGARLTRLTLFLADSAGGQPHFEAGFEAPLALIIGGEAEGAGSQAQKLATSRVHIPMPGEAESLNAAVAGAVLMFEVVRQRQLSVNGGQ